VCIRFCRRFTFQIEAFQTIKHCKEVIVRKLDRREFVIAGGAALAGASPASVFAQAAAPRLVMRRSVGSMQPDDPALMSYALAVERMKALPGSDPRSWERIVQVHVDFCPHSNWFFLPWHRAYLVSLERICRQVLRDPSFALPYWDWTEHRQVPAAFMAPTLAGRPNPLLDSTREVGPAELLGDMEVGPRIISRIMAQTEFENFGSGRPTGQNSIEARWQRAPGQMTELEGTPHGNTHVFVGGDMGDMVSPRDPIFFLHHCNIDRLWVQWIALGRRNPADPLWATFRFDGNFQTPQGDGLTAWNVGVADVLDHTAFGYAYPDLPAPDSQQAVASAEASSPPRVLASAAVTGTARANSVLLAKVTLGAAQPRREADTPSQVPASAGGHAGHAGHADPNAVLFESPLLPADKTPAPKAAGDSGGAGAPASVTAGIPDGRIFSLLEGLKASGRNAMRVNVFLNHPNPTGTTPESDPHFVGTFGVFGLQTHAAHEGYNVQVELTEAVARLRRANLLTGSQLDVQLVPVAATRNNNRERSLGGSNLEMSLRRIDIVTK
jgi:tyrosinase